jgi:peptidoglycan L-alanyl-D-glutamate endopeptidase CwlK
MDAKSLNILASCHNDLQRLAHAINKVIPIKVVEGYRNENRQLALYYAKRTKVKKGKHNTKPLSEAMDIYPHPVNWGDTKRMYFMGGVAIAESKRLNIPIRWGGDWDGDTEVLDQTFNDLGHIELKGE